MSKTRKSINAFIINFAILVMLEINTGKFNIGGRDRYWAIYNPRVYRQTKVNGDQKGPYINDVRQRGGRGVSHILTTGREVA